MHAAVAALALVVVAAQALLWLLVPRLQAHHDADVRSGEPWRHPFVR